MEPAGTNLGRFPSKFLLMVIPGLVASGVAASVLYAVHVSRPPSSSEVLTEMAPQGDGLSAEERRDLTRQMLKARRENPEEPAQVRPTPTSRPADSGPAEEPSADSKATADGKAVTDSKAAADSKAVTDSKAAADSKAVTDSKATADGKAVTDSKATADGKAVTDSKAADGKAVTDSKTAAKPAADRAAPDHASSDRTLAAAPLPVARPAPLRARPDAPVVAMPVAPAATSGATAPPVAAPAQPAPLPLGPDPAVRPVAANPSPGVEPEPQPRGFAANVFSSLSTMAGSAANATGNTVNWVIDLPGKAISAGGRLFGGNSSASDQPAGSPPPAGATPPAATVPPPATAPPPKRNL
jgi:hypothetical protein